MAEARCREQRLADAIAQGSPGDAAPEALLTALRAEETRRKNLEQQLATLPQPTTVASVDRDHVARELRTRADDIREALQTLLVDRVDCTPVLVAGARGYAFTGDGTFGGLLAASTWPTTYGGPNGIRTRVSALRGPCPGPLDDGATSAGRGGWLGEEDSNLHYGVQSPASYH